MINIWGSGRRAAALTVTGFALAATLSTGAGTASASVGDYYYDGKSAAATGCKNDAVTVDSVKVGGATLLLRYSPRCRTVWAHIRGTAPAIPGQQAGGSALIYREQDRAGIRCRTGRRTSCTTRMLYDGGFTSHASGTNDTGFTIYRNRTISY